MPRQLPPASRLSVAPRRRWRIVPPPSTRHLTKSHFLPGKYHPFEGGVRVVSFWSGGVIPPAARGTVSHALVHAADYYMTLCTLAGGAASECTADPRAAAAGLPPIDSHNVWPLVTQSGSTPGRREVPIDATVLLQAVGGATSGPWWKLFTNPHVVGAGWTGAVFPNSTSPDPESPTLQCKRGGCLFDVWSDPEERNDVAAAHPDIVAAMSAHLAELQKGFYSNSDSGGTDICPAGTGQCMCWAAANVHGGFLGPYHTWP